MDWSKWCANSGSSIILSLPQQHSKAAVRGIKLNPDIPTGNMFLDTDFVTRVNNIVNESISKSVSMNASLLEAGVDSLSAVEIRRNLEESMGTDLPATVVFDYPTVVD